MYDCYSDWAIDAPDDGSGAGLFSLDQDDKASVSDCAQSGLEASDTGMGDWYCAGGGCFEDGSGFSWTRIAIDYRCDRPSLGDDCSLPGNQAN